MLDGWLLDVTQLLLDPPVLLQWAVGFLASWRLAFLVVYEDGPWRVFARLRDRVASPEYHDGRLISVSDGFLPKVLSCVLCMTFWTTPLVYAILWTVPPLAVLIGTWGAASYLETLRPKD